jgi:hypothetical protein
MRLFSNAEQEEAQAQQTEGFFTGRVVDRGWHHFDTGGDCGPEPHARTHVGAEASAVSSLRAINTAMIT